MTLPKDELRPVPPPPILIPIPAFWGVEEVTARIPCAAPCVAVAAAG